MSNKFKSKVGKLIDKVDPQNDDNEHELGFYVNDRVQLMKEVLKIIKAKKIKNMAPDCIKDLDIEEINSMLLEELLGISNKRLRYIFDGQNLGEDSSSTDPEEEKQPNDIISLDDVSDDDFVFEGNSEKLKKKGCREPKMKRIKKEKIDKKNKQEGGPLVEENLMSVLELLELQARARAIRSQLTLEANKKIEQSTEAKSSLNLDSDTDDNSVIIEVPKSEEIVIDSSESESERQTQKSNVSTTTSDANQDNCNQDGSKRKITLIRNRFGKKVPESISAEETCNDLLEGQTNEPESVYISDANEKEHAKPPTSKADNNEESVENDHNNPADPDCTNDEDEIILIVDQEEIDGIIGD